MADFEKMAERDRHVSECLRLSGFSSTPEIKTLASALVDANEWLDANYMDLRNVFDRLSALEAEAAAAKEEIHRLNLALSIRKE